MADMQDDIRKYLSGKMTPAEMHALERKALHDPFLAEALEGAASIPHADFDQDIDAIHKGLHGRTNRRGGAVKTNWALRIAAGLLLLAAAASIIVLLTDRSVRSDERLALNKEAEETASPSQTPLADSVTPPMRSGSREQPGTEAVTKDVPPSPTHEAQQEVIAAHDAASPYVGMELQEITIEPAETETEEKPAVVAADVPAPVNGQAETAAVGADKKTAGSPAAPPTALRNKLSMARENSVNMVIGQVIDAEDGEPIPGVNVFVKETNIGTVTDIEGNYELTLPDPNSQLIFSFTGFANQEVSAEGKSVIDVQMDSDVAELSEVVVQDYYEDKILEGVTWDLAKPAGGHKAYYKYLEQNLVYPPQALASKIEGKVTVRFAVEPTGQLSNFRVVKSLGYGCDEEVIRLIREGPTWSPTKRNNEPVMGRVKVKMKFRLPG